MLAEKMLSSVVSLLGGKYFKLDPTPGVTLPDPNPVLRGALPLLLV